METKIVREYKLVLFVAYMFIFLSACTSLRNERIEFTSEVSKNSVEETLTKTPIVSKAVPSATSVVPTKGHTSTLTPTVTSTSMPSPTFTLAVIPTLPPDEALSTILELFETNGNCELPCWWGIMPGKTSLAEARTILSPLGKAETFVRGHVRKFDYVLPVPKEVDSLEAVEPNLFEMNDIIVAIGINSRWLKQGFDHSLVGILENFGQPDEIWVNLLTETQFVPHYEMDLFYSTRGIFFNSTGNSSVDQEGLSICPQEFKRGEFPPAVLLLSKEFQYRQIDAELLSGRTEPGISEFKPLAEITDDFDEEDFYKTYLRPTSSCIRIKLDN